jgi:hypothetical protein
MERMNEPSPEPQPLLKENFLKQYFNRHIAAIALSLLAVSVPEKPVEAMQAKSPAIEQVDSVALIKERRQALEDFMTLVDKNNLQKILDDQVGRFGLAAGGLFINRQVATDLRSMYSLYANKDKDDSFVNPKGTQFVTLGGILADAYNTRWQSHEAAIRPMQLKNIEAVPGLTADGLQKILEVIYPKNYLESCVASIEFINKSDIREKQNAEVLGSVQPFGLSTLFGSKDGDLRARIEINLPSKGISVEAFLDVLVHEIGHAFDPDSNSALNSAQRILMLNDIYNRSIAPDRYMSSYVEGITLSELEIYFKDANVLDPKAQKQYLDYIRATEYWAEIHKAYFDGSAQFEKKHPEDYKIVKKWVDVIVNTLTKK